MAQASRKQEQAPPEPAPESVSAVAEGGAIAEMQRTIEERMMGTSWHAASVALTLPELDGVTNRVSRLAGPALLAVAYAAVAVWWF